MKTRKRPFHKSPIIHSNNAIGTIELPDALGRSFISEIDILKTNNGFELHTGKFPKGTYFPQGIV